MEKKKRCSNIYLPKLEGANRASRRETALGALIAGKFSEPMNGMNPNTNRIKTRKPHTDTRKGDCRAPVSQVIYQRMTTRDLTVDFPRATTKAKGPCAVRSQRCPTATVS